MKTLNKRIYELTMKSIKLRALCFDLDYESAKKIREEQGNIYNKTLFFKNLKKALEKENYNEIFNKSN